MQKLKYLYTGLLLLLLHHLPLASSLHPPSSSSNISTTLPPSNAPEFNFITQCHTRKPIPEISTYMVLMNMLMKLAWLGLPSTLPPETKSYKQMVAILKNVIPYHTRDPIEVMIALEGCFRAVKWFREQGTPLHYTVFTFQWDEVATAQLIVRKNNQEEQLLQQPAIGQNNNSSQLAASDMVDSGSTTSLSNVDEDNADDKDVATTLTNSTSGPFSTYYDSESEEEPPFLDGSIGVSNTSLASALTLPTKARIILHFIDDPPIPIAHADLFYLLAATYRTIGILGRHKPTHRHVIGAADNPLQLLIIPIELDGSEEAPSASGPAVNGSEPSAGGADESVVAKRSDNDVRVLKNSDLIQAVRLMLQKMVIEKKGFFALKGDFVYEDAPGVGRSIGTFLLGPRLRGGKGAGGREGGQGTSR